MRDPRMQDPVWMKEKAAQVDCVMGHYPFAFYSGFKEPVRYFTVFREPVDRVVSMYYYHRSANHLDWVKNASLLEFLERHKPAENGQTRLICGDRDKPSLDVALTNLKGFAAVGLTERFNDSIKLFSARFGWNDTAVPRENVTVQRRKKHELSDRELGVIQHKNKLDQVLYEAAKKQFTRQLADEIQ